MIRQPKKRAFTLIEIMIAIMFVSIGFFGYVALHSRILHSGQKLAEREKVRASTSLIEALEVSRLMIGADTSVNGRKYVPVQGVEGLFNVNTAIDPLNARWLMAYPKEYLENMTETTEMRPVIPLSPYRYSWEDH